MHAANPLWGAPRMHGELQKLGLTIAPSTVAKYLARLRGSQKPSSQTWRTFLTNHLAQSASCDFFTVPTATFRVLFVSGRLRRTAPGIGADFLLTIKRNQRHDCS